MIPRGLLPALGAVLVAAFAGFLVGRWSITRDKAPTVTLGSPTPRPGADLSPKGERGTVKLASTRPGVPKAPPVPAPADLGEQVATTSTTLPPLPQGGILDAATFATLDRGTLSLRTVEWLDTPGGRAPLGPVETVQHVTTLKLPLPPSLPRWETLALPTLDGGRLRCGVEVGYTRGPLVLGAGVIPVGHDLLKFGRIGLRW